MPRTDRPRPGPRHLLALAGLALMALVAGVAEAQTSRPFDAPIRFRHLGLADGLAHPDVHAIHQDATGFLWFGTEDGLTRYDGTTLRVYRPVSFDTTSIPHAWTVGISDAASGGLWLAGEQGTLGRYDPRTDAFSTLPMSRRLESLWRLLGTDEGPLWLGSRTGGLYRYDPASGTLDAFSHDPSDAMSLGGNFITALLHDPGGGVWVGTQRAGLDLFRPRTKAFAHHRHQPGDPTSLPGDYVTALFRDRAGQVWVGTHDGLAAYRGGGFDAVPAVRGDAVWSIEEDPAGALWLGTSNGLVRYDPGSGSVARHVHDPADPSSIGAGDIRALFLDRGGVLWAATESGLSSFVWAAPLFKHVAPGASGVGDPGVWAFLVSRDGTLWVGTETSLDRFTPGGVTHFRHTPGDPGSLSPGWVVALHEDADGTLWVGTRHHESQPGALEIVDPASGRIVERFVTDPADPTSLPADNPWAFFNDRRGRLWVLSGGSGCPGLFDREARTFTPFCLTEGDETQVAKGAAELPDGTLLFATWGNGLAHLDPDSGEMTFLHHDPADPDTPASDYLLALHAGMDGTIWLGTYGAGVSRYDPSRVLGETGTFTHYATATSALPNDVVYAIETDANGDVWMSTNVGLTRLSPETEAFESFGLDDGLQDLEFNAGASYRAASGELFFGGIDGFNRFDPARPTSGSRPLPVVLTEVRVDDEPLAPGRAMAVAAPYAEAVRLGPRQRDAAFSFAALDYAAPERIRYRVRLEGYDTEWHDPGAVHTATYTNLDPGAYTFRVQATGPNGAWGDGGAALAVVVTPRFYEAWWFRLLAGLALVGLVGAAFAARERQRRETERHLEAQVAERTEVLHERTEALEAEKRTTEAQAERLREMDRHKTRFFTNVSHEFRTPLTLTIGPLEDLEADAPSLPAGARTMVDLALRNSRRLLRLINQLLDVARLDAGEMRLDAHALDLRSPVQALALSFAPLAERRRVDFEVALPETGVWAQADPDKLEHIVLNLLSNAFKFTPEGGTVRLAVAGEGEEVTVCVRDSGPGIAPGNLPRLFDRFYQTDETEPGGSGIGLSLAKDFAELHGGSLAVESEVGTGTAFTLRLPSAEPPAARSVPPGSSSRDDVTAPHLLAEPSRPSPDPEAAQDDRPLLLIADDNADIRAYVRGHLAPRYRVLEAPDGVVALALVREHLPDVVVSDVMMPRMGGIEVVRALRADRETDFVPVILLTAKAGEAATVAGLEAGADAYVVKPFNMRTLEARIDALVASRLRLRERLAETLAARDDQATDDYAIDDQAAVFVGQVRAAIEARLGDDGLTVENLSHAVGMSRNTLHRRLREAADVTPTAFVRGVRLAHAATLLCDGSGSVGEVAYAVGFKSVSYFSQAFRARYGTSPSAYADGGDE